MELTDQLHVREKVPDTHSIRGWVTPRADLDVMDKKKKFFQESTHDSSTA